MAKSLISVLGKQNCTIILTLRSQFPGTFINAAYIILQPWKGDKLSLKIGGKNMWKEN